MKKTLAVLVVLLVALFAVSAASRGEIVAGANLGLGLSSITDKDTDVTLKDDEIRIEAFGQYWFTDEFGATASLELANPFKLESDTADMVDYAKMTVDFTVAGNYKYALNKDVDLIAGLGFGKRSFKISKTIAGAKTTADYSYWVIEASAAGSYELDAKQALKVIGGVKLDVAISDLSMKQTITGVGSNSAKSDISGFGIVPFVGVTKAF